MSIQDNDIYLPDEALQVNDYIALLSQESVQGLFFDPVLAANLYVFDATVFDEVKG